VPEGVTVGKQQARHSCTCTKCGYETTVSTKVANKIKAGAKYKHRSCGGVMELPLKLSGKMVSIPTQTARAHTVPLTNQPKGSKLDICRRLWKDHNSLPKAPQLRATMIDMFIAVAGCTPAGAVTYYSKISKEMG
jgi:hypothetical protein